MHSVQEGKDPQINFIFKTTIEKNHSGAMTEIVKKFPDAPIYCTQKAVDGLKRHYSLEDANFNVVKTGNKLS